MYPALSWEVGSPKVQKIRQSQEGWRGTVCPGLGPGDGQLSQEASDLKVASTCHTGAIKDTCSAHRPQSGTTL